MSSEPAPRSIHVDAAVIGGGIAALWTAETLRAAGRSVVVLTDAPLGAGQTLAAQGVIHGGLKYAVAGKLTDSSEALAGMPQRWLDALGGKGPVDLSGARLLSDHQLLWSQPGVLSQVVGFFGSRAVRGRAASINRSDYPAPFDSGEYRGRLFRIEEPVVDPVSIVEAFSRRLAEHLHQIRWHDNARLEAKDGSITAVEVRGEGDSPIRLTAGTWVLAAGAGNGPLLEQIGLESPRQQLRPLHQVIVRKPDLPPFYSVCVGNGPKPPMVTTSHRDSEGRSIWYVGGDLAEKAGVERSVEDQIEAGKALFARLLPWVDLSDAEWFTWRGDRAEPFTGTGDRPPGAFCRRTGNVLVTWPTKLALAPHLADQVVDEVGAYSGVPRSPGSIAADSAGLPLPRPPIGRPPWDLP